FTANGTPASGPALLPAAIAASTSRALARARSAVTSVNELRMPSRCLIRASASSTASSAESLRDATAAAISEADVGLDAALMAPSGCEDTGRLGFVRQGELVDHPTQSQRHFEIYAHRGLPSRLDRQCQKLGSGVNIVIQWIGRHCLHLSCH